MFAAVPEGTRTKIGVPQIEISNTHKDFVWLVNTIETLLSCSMWHTQTSAEVGYRYRQIVDKYRELSCDDNIQSKNLLGDFSMRGQQSAESAIKSSIGWLCSFMNTATVPAIITASKYYSTPLEKVGRGAISTEHSVMCSNYAVDGDEITHIKRLLTEVYPNHSFSMVSDSYDYWNLVDNILPQCKEEILNHNGCLSIRGDSGDPVEVIAGKDFIKISKEDIEAFPTYNRYDIKDWVWDNISDYDLEEDTEFYVHCEELNKYYKINITCEWTNERGAWTDSKYYYVEDYIVKCEEIEPTSEIMGTVWALWQTFGGFYNSKGYKVLTPQIKAIYGDSITPQRCEEIYKRLTDKGFAINNVSLGVGSFSFMCLEENGAFNPYTRDTFGIAVKATYAEDKNGKPIMIYKQPKAASWKKSQKGCCVVKSLEEYTDELTWEETMVDENLLEIVWLNGEFNTEYTLEEVRSNMYPEGF
jgi:nicotinamide phosphoribosyltransferase